MIPKTHSIIATNWQTHRSSLREIRDLVFIQEQQVPIADEWDDKDETATHFLVTNLHRHNIGCARVLIEGELFHIGRVAILAEYRGQGIGQQLMQYVLEWCKQLNPEFGIYLHAQTSRMAFYKHLNFVEQGEVFMDAGIPHIEMWYDKKA